jgi:hypothetical protein
VIWLLSDTFVSGIPFFTHRRMDGPASAVQYIGNFTGNPHGPPCIRPPDAAACFERKTIAAAGNILIPTYVLTIVMPCVTIDLKQTGT